MRMTYFLKNGLNVFPFHDTLVVYSDTKFLVRNIDVYWDFVNVQTESTMTYGSTTITFKPGYYTFEDIQKKLKANSITLTLNLYDSTCTIFGEDHSIKLKSLGPLLGFEKDQIITADTSTTSSKKVNINQDIKYLTIDCNLVNISKNFFNGKRSQTVATLPISTQQRLNGGSISHFSDRFTKTSLYNGHFQEIGFDVKTSENVWILLECEIL